MKTIGETTANLIKKIGAPVKTAFIAAFLTGILTHMTVMVNDWPNHDGLASLYFDQNMITSGRWFLGTACGISSYYSLPWLTGLLSVTYISVTAMLIAEIFEIRSKLTAGIIGALLASFPALASTFAYVFTMDGYMLGLLMGVAAVFVTKKYRFGFIGGAVLLMFSIGTYQAYLPMVILLCIYMAVMRETKEGSIREKFSDILRYLYMGAGGGVLYLVTLKVMLAIQGKTLDSYQGINGMEGTGEKTGILSRIVGMYRDFTAFTIKSDILAPNAFAWIAIGLLGLAAAILLVREVVARKWYRSVFFYITAVLCAVLIPLAANIVMLISSDVTYHALMRYQWVFFPICFLAICDRFGKEDSLTAVSTWVVAICGCILILCYAVTDNIGYSNLHKKYERSYAYCVRLLDRIEQTPGYYQGIPVAMIGVIGTDMYPETDLTKGVTDNLIGLSGDYLLYKNKDYELFIRNYLGASLNMISGDEITRIYNSEEYVLMDSFPAENSVKLVDGIIYVKTENIDHALRENLK